LGLDLVGVYRVGLAWVGSGFTFLSLIWNNNGFGQTTQTHFLLVIKFLLRAPILWYLSSMSLSFPPTASGIAATQKATTMYHHTTAIEWQH